MLYHYKELTVCISEVEQIGAKVNISNKTRLTIKEEEEITTILDGFFTTNSGTQGLYLEKRFFYDYLPCECINTLFSRVYKGTHLNNKMTMTTMTTTTGEQSFPPHSEVIGSAMVIVSSLTITTRSSSANTKSERVG
jgi:hypothetical protein